MHSLLENLTSSSPILVNGAWRTQLRGFENDLPSEGWNLSKPRAVEELALAYVECGCRIITTNTSGANRYAMDGSPLSGKIREINMAGVEISRKAARNKALVFASMGPSTTLPVTNGVTENDLVECFAQQAEAFRDSGADGIVIESMRDLNEAVCAIHAAKETGLPLIACMTFDSGKNLDMTVTGNTPEEMARAFSESGADAIGANCGQGIPGLIPVCRRLKTATDLPVWIKPSALAEHSPEGSRMETFLGFVPELVAAGATFIGGCCGTGPELIRETGKLLKQTRESCQ